MSKGKRELAVTWGKGNLWYLQGRKNSKNCPTNNREGKTCPENALETPGAGDKLSNVAGYELQTLRFSCAHQPQGPFCLGDCLVPLPARH